MVSFGSFHHCTPPVALRILTKIGADCTPIATTITVMGIVLTMCMVCNRKTKSREDFDKADQPARKCVEEKKEGQSISFHLCYEKD